MKLALLLIPIFLLASCMSGGGRESSQQENRNYYDALYTQCMKLDRSEKGGCVTSVEWMEKNNFKEAVNSECPAGTTLNMNKTLGSKQWCEPLKSPSTDTGGTKSSFR